MSPTLPVDDSPQRGEHRGHKLHFIQHERAGPGGEAALDLKQGIIGEQLPQPWFFQVEIGRLGKSSTSQRGLAHLAWSQDEHRWEFSRKVLYSGRVKSVPHAPHIGSACSKIKAKVSSATERFPWLVLCLASARSKPFFPIRGNSARP